MKYLGIKLTGNVQNLYEENFKTLLNIQQIILKQIENHPLFLDRMTLQHKDIISL